MDLIKEKTTLAANSILLIIIVVLFAGMMLVGCDNPVSPGGPGTPSGKPVTGGGEGKLLILQAYGTGDNDDGAVSHSFVELYNNTNTAVNLTGYSLQYAAGTKTAEGKTEDGDWTVIELSGSIPAKGSYLVLGKKMNAGGRLQIADNFGDKNDNEFVLSNRAFKIALIQSTAKLTVQNPFDIDGKGTKAAGYIDMAGATNDDTDQILGYEEVPAKISKQKAIRRTFLTDTDDNSVDFESVDYRTSGITALELERKKPRNTAVGAWTPTQEPELGTSSTTPKLMILQFGAATDGAISHSFVELYNNTDTAIDLGTYSLQYAAGTKVADGATADGTWIKINLTGTIQPYHSFLILGNKGTTTEPALSLENGSGDMNVSFSLSNRAVKIALMSNQNLLTVQNPFDIDGKGATSAGYVDMVGAENDATDKIFGYEFAPARLSKQQAPRRAKLTDTDNNSADFSPVDYRTADQTIPRPRNHANGAWDPRNGNAGKPGETSGQDRPPEVIVVEPPVTSADYTKLKLNEVSGFGADSEKFYELINTGTGNISLEGCKIYYNANSAAGGTLPTGKGNLTWTGSSSQIAQAGKLFSLIGRNTTGSFTTGLTAQRILIITLEDPAGNVIDKCVRAEDTGAYNFSDKSFSRIPDGTGDFYFTTPTPNATNGTSTAGLTKVPVEPVVQPPVVTPPSESSVKLMIWQVGSANVSNPGAVSHGFIELYNAGDAAVNLSGYSLQYAAGTATTASADGAWSVIALEGTVQPHRSFLVLGTMVNSTLTVGTTSSNTQYNIPANSGDMNKTFTISNDAFKVALMSNTTQLTVQNPFNTDGNGTKSAGYVDMVGANNNYSIGGYETTACAKMSKQQTVRRKSLTDTDNNNNDFESVDYRGNGSSGVTTIKYPHNSSFGAWNPVTGAKE